MENRKPRAPGSLVDHSLGSSDNLTAQTASEQQISFIISITPRFSFYPHVHPAVHSFVSDCNCHRQKKIIGWVKGDYEFYDYEHV